MKTKQQKEIEFKTHLSRFSKNATMLFVNFKGVPAGRISNFRQDMINRSAEFRVVKKRVFGLALKENGIDLNSEIFDGQLGVIFSPEGLSEIAGPVFKFIKDNENFVILGGYDLTAKQTLSSDYLQRIASLPSREVLLGQLVGMVAAPLKMFMLALNERAKTL